MRTVPLQQICDIQIGKTPSRSVPAYWDGDLPWVTISDLGPSRIVSTTKERITRIGAARSGSKLIPRGNLLLSFKLSLGKRAFSGCDLYTNEAIAALHILDHDVADPGYLYWALGWIDYDRLVDRAAKGKTLNKAKLKILQIPLPPIAMQKRIAEILDSADALRVKRREAIVQLDTLLQSTFLDMFGDPITNPKAWEVRPLNELLEEKPTNGAYYPKDAYKSMGTRMVHMANAFYGVVNPNEVKRVDAPPADIEKYHLRPTDILVSRRSLNYEGSAKPCLIPETDEPLIFESSLIRVRPDPGTVLNIYLFHYLLNDRARAKYVFPLVTRSTISGISQSNLMKVKVLLPPLALQLRFADAIESMERQTASQRAHLDELDTLFASLQSRAFRGEL